MEWTGFTDEDLRRLQKSSFNSDAAETAKVIGNRTQKIAARNVRQKRIMTSSRGGSVIRAGEPLSPEQRLTQSHDVSNNSSSSAQPVSERTSSSSSAGISEPQSKETSNKNTDTAVVINTDAETKLSESNCDHATVTDQLEDTTLDLDEQSILTKELASLDKFREHQKMIEELNARKKRMLTEAIQQRQHKAKVESAKLNLIKKELDRLDQMINADVSVIRDKIEVASREFLDAQKRYDRAEREFIEAKMDLHGKSEAKDLLTEHLYTVIHQNEVRKAKKLAELTHKLELESTEDDDQVLEASVPVPLCLVMPINRLTSTHGPTSPTSTPHQHTDQHVDQHTDRSQTSEDQETSQPLPVSSENAAAEQVSSPAAPD